MTKDPTKIIFREEPSHEEMPSEALDQLLKRARAGSLQAYRSLRQRYRPLIETSVARYVTSDMTMQEREDMKEEAERVFLSAVSTYDTEQDGVDFGLYAKICLRNGLVSEVRRLHTRRRIGIVPLESDLPSAEDDPGRAVEEAERFRRLYHLIHGCLSDFENEVWWRYVSGVSVRQIAAAVNRDQRAVHNAIYRIRKKLRSLLSAEDYD